MQATLHFGNRAVSPPNQISTSTVLNFGAWPDFPPGDFPPTQTEVHRPIYHFVAEPKPGRAFMTPKCFVEGSGIDLPGQLEIEVIEHE